MTPGKQPRYDIAAMTDSYCPTCGSAADAGDNYCRRCGIAIGGAQLPAVRATSSATIWQPTVSPMVKGAVVMAAGTVGQFVFRRVVSGLLGSGRRHGKSQGLRIRGKRNDDGMMDEAQIVTEMVMVRRMRVRREP